ncbi:MAG: serine/threonine protein kinase [Prosthecobacter sp.]|uniref:serine/threonine-protein kinase n=1 Tax=Prosthecobacter sp. TaxID=1965333 RepID=UPI0025F133C5|nr:serine/threonine-protein kinase [Prosthecobacter sp.]MCF7788424.1 serine/threonine protein kinase [Prosthecobacter sp.]
MSQESPAEHQPPFDVPSVEEMAALLPQYAFEKLAAFGGMGAVYRARQVSLDRLVAIKILPPEFGRQEDFADRFKSEARAMAKLNHTHIVGVYDFGITTEGHLYLVMEWVEGQTLHTLIQNGSIPVRKAASLAMQLCDALAFAHHHKILHRDIKPGNIMISEDDQVKVADFGLARPITGEAEENPFGTPDYAAPEILGKGAVDQRADIFAAGVVLYEMLAGRVPQHPRRSVQEFAPLSPRWDELIDKATHPDPAKRFQDVGEFRAHIALLINQSSQAVGVVAVVEDETKAKAALKPLNLVMIGAAVIVIGIVLGMMFKGEPAPEVAQKQETAISPPKADEPEAKPKVKKVKEPGKRVEPVVVVPVVEPEMKQPEAAPPPAEKMIVVVPAPAPPPAPVAEVMPKVAPLKPPPETPQEAILRLEKRDPELAQMVIDFGAEWLVNTEIGTETEMQSLADKYIPALQRGLSGLVPQQRDFVLSEISHIANHEPLGEPDLQWPEVLKTLRKAYDVQREAIQGRAEMAAQKMRAAQCELVLQKAREREAAGKTEAAKRAVAVAAELAKLKTAPSLSALRQSVAGATGVDPAPATAAEPVR